MQCATCHPRENFDPGGVPGNFAWHMAPIEMAWAGKSLGEICVQIKDTGRNGGMSLDEIVHHTGRQFRCWVGLGSLALDGPPLRERSGSSQP